MRPVLRVLVGGNLKEILFDGSAKNIVHLLAVLVRPWKSSHSPKTTITPLKLDKHMKRKANNEVPGGCLRRYYKLVKAKSYDPGDGANANTDRSVVISNLLKEFIEDVIYLDLTTRDYIYDYYTSADLYTEDKRLKNVLVNKLFKLFHFTSPNVSDIEEVTGVRHKDLIFKARRFKILIFRNLTIREFVRSEAIALKPRYIRGPDIFVLSFNEVVLSRIYYLTSLSVRYRFDITTLARYEGETSNVGWRNVSDKKSEYSVDLRDKL
ncbi:hypothetical protein QBC46DRAFT_368429 [Diplogelasinospora grovesii]|uniref:Uncharacterized protein n=1 Tax=Diplogelasinospora grovesii TaxID=303347 RepID=A0AAN6MXI3_9PEZI|nr:hypothetical protein QBC46DRAFT_368429 [Diplogelasinospora grovesii]